MNKAGLLLMKAGSRTLRMISQGLQFEQVSEGEAQKRIELCNGCEMLTKSRQCHKCGCEVDFKVTLKTDPVMTGFNIEKTNNICPLGKW